MANPVPNQNREDNPRITIGWPGRVNSGRDFDARIAGVRCFIRQQESPGMLERRVCLAFASRTRWIFRRERLSPGSDKRRSQSCQASGCPLLLPSSALESSPAVASRRLKCRSPGRHTGAVTATRITGSTGRRLQSMVLRASPAPGQVCATAATGARPTAFATDGAVARRAGLWSSSATDPLAWQRRRTTRPSETLAVGKWWMGLGSNQRRP